MLCGTLQMMMSTSRLTLTSLTLANTSSASMNRSRKGRGIWVIGRRTLDTTRRTWDAKRLSCFIPCIVTTHLVFIEIEFMHLCYWIRMNSECTVGHVRHIDQDTMWQMWQIRDRSPKKKIEKIPRLRVSSHLLVHIRIDPRYLLPATRGIWHLTSRNARRQPGTRQLKPHVWSASRPGEMWLSCVCVLSPPSCQLETLDSRLDPKTKCSFP